jgi:hypothetical protein
MNKNKRLQNAIDFINFNIKFGVYGEDLFDEMTDDELLKFVEYETARADLAVDDYKENYLNETYLKGGEK